MRLYLFLYLAHCIGPCQHAYSTVQYTLPRHFGGRRFGASTTCDSSVSVCLVVVPFRLLSVCRLPSPAVNSQHTHRSQTKLTGRRSKIRGQRSFCFLWLVQITRRCRNDCTVLLPV